MWVWMVVQGGYGGNVMDHGRCVGVCGGAGGYGGNVMDYGRCVGVCGGAGWVWWECDGLQ